MVSFYSLYTNRFENIDDDDLYCSILVDLCQLCEIPCMSKLTTLISFFHLVFTTSVLNIVNCK